VGDVTVGYIDVDRKEDLPTPPAGRRYLDFLGGTRQLRCYLVDESLPRSEFLRSRSDLDTCHTPIFDHAGIRIGQDSSFALPGFYVLSYGISYPAIDRMSLDDHLRGAFLVHELRRGMRDALSLQHIHLHYEEKAEPSCNVHYWLVPIDSRKGDKSTALTRLQLRAYIAGFSFQEQRATILSHNSHMRQFFADNNTAERLTALTGRLNVPQVNGLETERS
jgi:hypothetical protein